MPPRRTTAQIVEGNDSLRNLAEQATALNQANPGSRPGEVRDGEPEADPRSSSEARLRPGSRPQAEAGSGNAKADFIAAARRAAQAAALESERVEQEQSEKRGFLSRLRGGNKSKSGKAERASKSDKMDKAMAGMSRADPSPGKMPNAEQPAQGNTRSAETEGQNRQNRQARRAAIADAARKAKKNKSDEPQADGNAAMQGSTPLRADLPDGEAAKPGLISGLRQGLSRYSRPLLMAAAAILLAITTLQLAQNPNSSLHGLFNNKAQQSQEPQLQNSDGDGEAPVVGPKDAQSSLTPPAGSLLPLMSKEEANRAIAFAQPSGAQSPMHGPLVRPEQSANGPRTLDAPMPGMSNAPGGDVASLTPNGRIPQASAPQAIDPITTGTSPMPPNPNLPKLQQEADNQPMPPLPDDGEIATSSTVYDDMSKGAEAALDPSIKAAVEMNKLLAPGIADSALMTAAKAGDSLAQFEVGRRLTLGLGMTADLAQAAQWFEKAAAQNMPQAQYSLANLYEKGKGVKRDAQVARLWYERAANQGNIKSMHNLAVLYAEGGLGKPDFVKASQWFERAAAHGLKDSQYNLAILYARGMGTKQDLVQSYKWFAIAAGNGDSGAVSKRDEVFKVLNQNQQLQAQKLVTDWVPNLAKPSANNLASLPEEWQLKAPAQVVGSPTAAKAPQGTQSDVARVQSLLATLGYNAGPADGVMGPRTRMAIRNFQEVAGLPVTGQIDGALIEALSMRAI